MILIDLATFFTNTAKLSALPTYIEKALKQAGEGKEIILTGKAPVWLYLAVAHSLQGKAKKMTYRSPVTGLSLTIYLMTNGEPNLPKPSREVFIRN